MPEISKLRERYLEIAEPDGISVQELENIEYTLGVTLPDDFKQISQFFGGECLGAVENYSFVQGAWDNITDETKRLREAVKLPFRFVVLAEPPESVIVMDVEDKPSVIWCDLTDIYHLETKAYTGNPDVWESYSDFFAALLSDEESACL